MRYKRIPNEFHQQSTGKASFLILQRFGAFLLCLSALTYLLAIGAEPVLLALLGPILVFVGSVSLHNIALLGHEGTHFTLAKDRYKSALIGTVCSSFVPLHFNTGFAVSHALHHWHANTEKDPDLKMFSKFTNIWSRLFMARSQASRQYLFDTIKLARGVLPYRNQVGIQDEKLFRLAKINLALSLLITFGYLAAAFLFSATFGIAFGVIYVFAVLLSSVRPFMEHVGTDSGQFSNSRTFTNPLLDFTFGTINFHLAHHMYPQVPAYNLPKLNTWLVENEFIPGEQAVVQTSTLGLVSDIATGSYGASGDRGGFLADEDSAIPLN